MHFSTLAAVSAIALASSVVASPTPVNDYDLAARGDEEFYLRSIFYDDDELSARKEGTSGGPPTAGRKAPSRQNNAAKPETGQPGEPTGHTATTSKISGATAGDKAGDTAAATGSSHAPPVRKGSTGHVATFRRSLFYDDDDEFFARAGEAKADRPAPADRTADIPTAHTHRHPGKSTAMVARYYVDKGRSFWFQRPPPKPAAPNSAAPNPAAAASNGAAVKAARDLDVEEIMEIIARGYYGDYY